ncbi:hypothetical protein N0V95_005806 [Ascochyta clinopodiicola]|nr:hypothetical protein N0V95_005806 [Ascochyta clinopodiicola]
MSNPTIPLLKRLRAHTISLPVTRTQHAVFSNPLNIDAWKQRAADWEPALPLARLKTASKYKDGDDDGTVAYMATFSAFDPGATHPLLLSCALPMSLAGSADANQRSSVEASLELQTSSTTSSLYHATEVRQSGPETATEEFKPWPYSLPRVLRPQVGTTYGLTYGDGGRVEDVEVGVLQKVFYGAPEPDRVLGQNEGVLDGIWRKVLYGMREGEEEGKAGC